MAVIHFSNPILSGFHPDPSICRVGSDYYLANSSFGYFPGVPIFHSQDLVNWTQIGHCLTRESQLPLKANHQLANSVSFAGIYAPTIRYHDGRFYLITTNVSSFRNFVVWAENAEGPWSEPVDLEWGGIDPSLLFDEGKVYITGTSDFGGEPEGIYQAEIDLGTGKLVTERRLIWKGTGGRFPEGPHLYRIQDKYYLVIAEGGTEYGHMVTVARSSSPYGPFESCPHNPVLTHRSHPSPIQATGHADWVQAHDGSWWVVFLGIRPAARRNLHHLGRETFLAPIHWSEEGWPIFGINGRVELEMEAPVFCLEPQKDDVSSRRDDFDSEALSHSWNSLWNPREGTRSLQARAGWLALYGTEATLDDLEAPTFVGRRQQHFECRISALMEFDPSEEGEEAGLTAFMNESAHYEIAVTRKNGVRTIFFRRRIGSLWKVEREEELPAGAVVLGIAADADGYQFTYANPEREEVALGKGESAYLSSEIAGGFTGIYIGMYATGNGKPCRTPAFFDYFDYQSLISGTCKR
ncbi:glycoside hydrolase family 43 protein [Cohnella endophytica]|uniref:Glycoside hydrolase family 43 protein n=1 Tax=Cohnella endophytica TaxID=2419778 RepID=A0A494Y0G2_9BACL|nr:glycoside hydrolase family 43 protein [Cohnella endophytica]RKP56247.1 glycoside hydrolase family 43 protein [Cohnella endophytica]